MYMNIQASGIAAHTPLIIRYICESQIANVVSEPIRFRDLKGNMLL